MTGLQPGTTVSSPQNRMPECVPVDLLPIIMSELSTERFTCHVMRQTASNSMRRMSGMGHAECPAAQG